LTSSKFARRVASDVKEEAGRIVAQELKDPRIGMTSVVSVDMSPDLKIATIFLSILDHQNAEDTIEGLNNAKGFIRSELADRLNLKYVPELRFEIDKSIQRGERVERILDELKEEDEIDNGSTDSR